MAKTVLLIEDDRYDRRLIVDALKEADDQLNVRVEMNGLDAVLYVKGEVKFADRKTYPPPDLIVLDLGLPLFDGYEFPNWVRKNGPSNNRNVPVVVLTGSDRPEDVSQAYHLGANTVITKPTHWEEFSREVKGLTRFCSSNRTR